MAEARYIQRTDRVQEICGTQDYVVSVDFEAVPAVEDVEALGCEFSTCGNDVGRQSVGGTFSSEMGQGR